MLDLAPYIGYIGWPIYGFIFVCGLVLGSFLNSWIWRRRENIAVSGGFSICVHCRRQLVWWEKFPVFSYLYLRGRCRTCHKPIPWHYCAVELATAFLLTLIAVHYLREHSFSEWNLVRDVFFLTFLIIIFVFDSLYGIILSEITWLGTFAGALINYLFLNQSLYSLALGMAVGGGFFLVQFLISRGRWIGGGDVRLGVMIGAWLGWPVILVALFFAYLVGAIVAIALLVLKKRNLKSEIPFGTFLAGGTLLAIYYGPELINWYWTLTRF